MAGEKLIKGERRIGNATFIIHQMPYSESKPLFWIGSSLVAPAIEAVGKLDVGKLLEGDPSELLEGEIDVTAVGKAFRIFFDRASYSDFERFEEAFTSKTMVKLDDQKGPLPLSAIREVHWPSAGYASFLKWFVFSVQVHFFPFSVASGQAEKGSREASTP